VSWQTKAERMAWKLAPGRGGRATRRRHLARPPPAHGWLERRRPAGSYGRRSQLACSPRSRQALHRGGGARARSAGDVTGRTARAERANKTAFAAPESREIRELLQACTAAIRAWLVSVRLGYRYFSLRANQPPTTNQQYFSLRINQHQP
jgi:hypothetical protein